MLKIENIHLAPGEAPDALTAQAARLLKVREQELSSVHVLRRSIDAREDPVLVYTVAVSVKDEAAVLRRCRSKKVSRLGALPRICFAVCAAGRRKRRRWWWVPGRRGCSPLWCWPGRVCGPLCWNGEDAWSIERRMWSTSGAPACWIPGPTCSLERGAPAPFPTESSTPAPGTPATASFWSS